MIHREVAHGMWSREQYEWAEAVKRNEAMFEAETSTTEINSKDEKSEDGWSPSVAFEDRTFAGDAEGSPEQQVEAMDWACWVVNADDETDPNAVIRVRPSQWKSFVGDKSTDASRMRSRNILHSWGQQQHAPVGTPPQASGHAPGQWNVAPPTRPPPTYLSTSPARSLDSRIRPRLQPSSVDSPMPSPAGNPGVPELPFHRGAPQNRHCRQAEAAYSGPPVAALSEGSLLHDEGKCNPCIWYWRREGCQRGVSCPYCHRCDAFALGKLKKQKRSLMKQLKHLKEGGPVRGCIQAVPR